MASTITRWRAKFVVRKALLAYAYRQASYWRKRRTLSRRGTSAYSHAISMLAKREKLVAERRAQAVYAQRVIARHTPKGRRSATGIDISNNNGRVNLPSVAHAGYDFVFCKATEGLSFRDSFFAANIKAAKKAGLLVGGYHFLHHGNADAQAAAFCSMVKAARCNLRPVCDVEIPGVTETDVAAFVAGVKRRLGVAPLIYTSPAFLQWSSTHGCGLWVANYGVPRPSVPHPWTSYAIWQHSSDASVPGVAGRCDANRCPDLSQITA